MAVKGLKKARSLFNSGKYKEVIRLLEPEIFAYRESFTFFYLLGVSCLYSGELGGALSYLKRANQLEENHVNTHLYLAIVYLKKTDKETAIRTWLKVLEIDPKNRIAQRGLNYVRKSPEPEDIIALSNSKKIFQLFPTLKKNLLPHVLFSILILMVISVSTLVGVQYLPKILEKKIRPGIANYELPEKGLIDYSQTYSFTFSEKEIRATFAKAKKLFNEYKDNHAIVEINRLLHSNASMDVKSIMYAMKDHMQIPDFSTLQKADSFSYTDVIGTSFLYENCFIRWEGRVGGLQVTESAIIFDFWVGNTTEFFGVVPVILYKGDNLANGKHIEVLGEVKVDQTGKVMIEGIGVHLLAGE